MPILDPAPLALPGRLDLRANGVRDYCSQLSEAFGRCGEHLDIVEMRWENHGWLKAIRQLWREGRLWRGRWVLFQNTALMWSRRGFPIRALGVLWILKLRGASEEPVQREERQFFEGNCRAKLP